MGAGILLYLWARLKDCTRPAGAGLLKRRVGTIDDSHAFDFSDLPYQCAEAPTNALARSALSERMRFLKNEDEMGDVDL